MSVGRELYHLALFPLYFTPLPLHSIIMPNPDHSLQALIEEYERLIASGEPFYMEAESLSACELHFDSLPTMTICS